MASPLVWPYSSLATVASPRKGLFRVGVVCTHDQSNTCLRSFGGILDGCRALDSRVLSVGSPYLPRFVESDPGISDGGIDFVVRLHRPYEKVLSTGEVRRQFYGYLFPMLPTLAVECWNGI